MKLLRNKEINLIKWRLFLEQSPFSSPFQTPDFHNFVNSVEGVSSDVFALEDTDILQCLLVVTIQKERGIQGFFSRRGIIYGGPILNSDNHTYLVSLLKKVIEYYKNKLIYLEIRNYFDYSNLVSFFSQIGFKLIPWLNFHIDLTDLEVLKKNMSNSRLRQIKKALKSGAEWKIANNLTDIESFYSILEDLYNNKIKKPLFPKQFFTEFYSQNVGKYLLVYFDNKVIGGIMCLIFENRAIYEFYVCGLDNEYKDQYPSVMATWAAIEYALQNNIPLFDFMGAGSPDEDYGVREFKLRFGGRQVEYGRFLRIINPFMYQFGKLGLMVIANIKK